jgi:hypothetical protein
MAECCKCRRSNVFRMKLRGGDFSVFLRNRVFKKADRVRSIFGIRRVPGKKRRDAAPTKLSESNCGRAISKVVWPALGCIHFYSRTERRIPCDFLGQCENSCRGSFTTKNTKDTKERKDVRR